MAIYAFKGLDRAGKEIKSSISSENLVNAKQKVKSMGIMLIEIKEQRAVVNDTKSVFSFKGRVSVSELSLMTRQLSTLIKAKIPIAEALNAIIDQVDSPNLKLIMSQVKQAVNEGSSLAKALSNYPKVFNTVYVNMVEAGEASGTLEIVLIRLAEFTESQVKLKNKVQSAMLYPVIMGFFGFTMMNVIFIFVIPKIAKIFESSKKELPWMTKLCITISQILQSYWWAIIMGMIAGYYLLQKYIMSPSGEKRWHSLQLRLPIIAELVKMINVSRFCSTLATLLNSGVPILTALSIVKNLIPNVHMKEAVENARMSVSEGASMVQPLMQSGLFPTMVTHMIKLGEQSGELEPMLHIVADNYQDQVENKLNGLTSVLEPIMLIVLGVAVAFIVFSVIVPMMSLNSMK